jgi:hypothetical protein
MRPLATRMFCAALAIVGLGCSVNILKTFANTSSNEALYIDAQTAMNNNDYNGALSKIGSMTGDYPTLPKVLELKASAFGGLCGFVFLPFVQSFAGMGNTLLFPFLLKNFDAAAAANIDNCVLAQNTMESIGPITSRTADENVFIALIAFAKIGNVLSFYADPTKTGSATAGFDPCAVGVTRTNPGNQITDSDAREIGTGLSLAAANLSAVAGQVQLGSGSVTAITNVCAALPAAYDFCAITDPAAFTANEVKGIRSLVKENSVMGLGSNCTGDVTTCFCP